MLKIVQNLCPVARYPIKCPYTRKASRVVIHNTANNAPAENEVAYMLNRPEEVSFHYAVDHEKAVQGLPEDRNAWASGDGRGRGNMEGIHIEICYSLSGGQRFAKAEQNGAELAAGLLKKYGWSLNQVTKHQDYDGKYCPHRTLDLGWQRFLNMVKAELEKLNDNEKEAEEMKPEEVKKLIAEEAGRTNPVYDSVEQVPDYWREDIRELVEKGIIGGTGGGKLGMTKSDCKAAVIAKRIREKL